MGSFGDSAPRHNIYIPVHESSDARVYDREDNLIQKVALEELRAKVDETCRRIPDFKRSLVEEYSNAGRWTKIRYHDVIAVLGERGSGKTTFILNALGKICEDRDDKIRNIGIIDPTLIDVKESIFLNIISRIRAEVDHWHARTFEQPGSSGKYEVFLKSLNNLARGIAQINGIGSREFSHDAWDSPSFIMEEGLANVLQGEFLERDFHVFINRALECLDQEAFIVAFDDIDTNFTRGWDVLEIIRKYLTSPQLVVLLSGDFDLYSCLVRMNQWAYFEQGYLDKEVGKNGSLARFNQRVDSLEDQYLLKIMKPSRRIELMSMRQVVQQHEVKVIFPGIGENDALPIKDVLVNMLRRHYHLSPFTGLEVAVFHLIKQPVRTIIQVLQCIDDRTTARQAGGDIVDPLAFHRGMAKVFDTPLNHFGFHSNDILAVQTRFGMNVLALRLLENDLLEEGASLRLGPEAMERDSVAMVMSGLYGTAIWRQPSLVGDYFIKVLQTRDILGLGSGTKGERAKRLKRELEIDELSLFTAESNARLELPKSSSDEIDTHGYYRISGESVRKGSASTRISSVWGNDYSNVDITASRFLENVNAEDVSVYVRPYVRAIQENSVEASNAFGLYINTLDTLSVHIRSWHKSVLNALFVRVFSEGLEVSSYLSAYQLVSLLSLLGGESLETIESTLQGYLRPKGQGRVSVEAGEYGTEDSDDDYDQNVGEDVFDSDSFGSFLSLIKTWQRAWPGSHDGLQFSTYDGIWRRFVRTIEKSVFRTKHVGHVLEVYSTALLDAVLVEEAWHRFHSSGDSKFRIPHYVYKDTLKGFGDRLGQVHASRIDMEKDLPLFCWFLSCPLWPVLLPQVSHVTVRVFDELNKAEDAESKIAALRNSLSVDYSGVEFPGTNSLLNTLCFPGDFNPNNTIEATRTRLIEKTREYLASIDGAYDHEYAEFFSVILSRKWDEISQYLANYNISSFGLLETLARNQIYYNFVSGDDGTERTYLQRHGLPGISYLKAFLELYLERG